MGKLHLYFALKVFFSMWLSAESRILTIPYSTLMLCDMS
jgi:hypothetical protein